MSEKIKPETANDFLVLEDPSTWTVSSLDQVAEAVRANPSARYAPAFWNTYRGPFSDIPCNEPLRSVIIRAKRSHPTYAPIPDEEYLGDVMALMGTKMLLDWIPSRETLEHYIRCRCRPNAEYGRSILKAHGNRVYALVKKNEDGTFHVCTSDRQREDDCSDHTKKYVNQPVLSMDAAFHEGRFCIQPGAPGAPENGFAQVEAESLRTWLMKVCRVTEYEMQICEAVADYGKCLDARIVQEINEKIVLPAANPPMTQEDIYRLNFRVHKRARNHYGEAMAEMR